jgi:hypothetical protein
VWRLIRSACSGLPASKNIVRAVVDKVSPSVPKP